MTDDELKAIEWRRTPLTEREAADLVAEVRRLRALNREMALKWIPPGIAMQAALDAQDSVVEKLAQLAESQHEPDVAAFIRDAWSKSRGAVR